MTYSYVDFTDDIITTLQAYIPARCKDSPNDQARICIGLIEHLEESNEALLEALKGFLGWYETPADDRQSPSRTASLLINALDKTRAAIKLAETPPEPWPEEEPETLYRIEITKPGDEKPYLIFEHRLDDDVAAAKRLYGHQGDKVEAIEEEA